MLIRHRRLSLVTAAIFMVFPGPAVQASDNRLDTLTVIITPQDETAGLPLAVTRVQADDLPAPGEQSLRDLLAPAPGLYARNQDNAAQGLRVSIRGFGARAAFGVRGIRVSVDGVPLTLPDGQTELDALDLGLLESVDIVRGPSATLFGNAAGGALLLTTREPAETPEARLELRGGSHGNRRARLEGSTRLGETSVLGAFTAAGINGFRDHAETDSRLLNARLERPLGDGRLRAFVSVLDISADDPGALTAAEANQNRRAAAPGNLQFNAGETIEQQRLALAWTGPLGDWSLRTTGFAGRRDFANRLPFTGGGQVSFDRSFGGVGATLSRRFEGSRFTHRISTGLDAQLQKDDRRRFDNNNGARGALTLAQDEEAAGAGFFLRDSIALTRQWETSLGVRYDTLRLKADDRFLADGDDSGKRDINDFSADISLSRRFEHGMIYARLASSFETPTINELANPNGGGFNPDLDSSEALNREIGIKGNWQALRYSAALYRIEADDELLPFELPGQSGRSFFRNAGKTRRQGIELSAGHPVNANWRVDASYSYASNRFAAGALDDNHIPGIPRQTAWLAATHQRGPWKTAVIGNYSGRLFADDANSVEVAGYGLLHLQAAFKPAGSWWEIEAAIDNLLDRDYNDNIRINAFGGRYFEPAAGRTYRAALRFSR